MAPKDLTFTERTPGIATATTTEGKDDIVYVRMVVNAKPPASKSGKTVILASTHGAAVLPVGDDVARLSINLYR